MVERLETQSVIDHEEMEPNNGPCCANHWHGPT